MRVIPLAVLLAATSFAGLAAAETPLLRAGQAVQGQLGNDDPPTGDGGVSRDYRIEAKAGDLLIVTAASQAIDAKLTVYGPDRATLAENDDRTSDNFDPLVVAEIKADGVYRIRVASLGGGDRETTGPFTLRAVAYRE